MANNGYALNLYDPQGANLGELTQYAACELAYGQGTPGVCVVTLADKEKRGQDYAPLTMLEVMREVEGIWSLEGERIWWLMDTVDFVDSSGAMGQSLVFYDANAMLKGRYVLYQAGAANAEMTDNADDMLKSIVDVNCTTNATDTTRAWQGLTIEADKAACASVTKAFAWKPVLSTLRDICTLAAESGTYLIWDFVRTGIGTFEMRTYTGQRGVNRGSTSSQMLRLTVENGGLVSPSLKLARAGAPNHVTAAGRGVETARSVKTSTATPSPAGMLRWEGFIDRRNVDTDALLQAEADAEYQRVKPRFVFSGGLGQTNTIKYGYDLRYGDIVSVYYAGYEIDAHFRSVHISLDGNGNETLEIGLKNYD